VRGDARPGDNSEADNNRRIETGRYPLRTHSGPHYMTLRYQQSGKLPGFEVGKVTPRYGILVHPGRGFKASVGCFNPAKQLATAASVIERADSLPRVVAMIEDMKAFLAASFPNQNDQPIPNAWIVVDGEP
jgi:hypothetical protein